MNAGVEPFADDILAHVVDADLQPDLGIFRREARDQRGNHGHGGNRMHGETERSRRFVAECIDRVDCLVNAFENRSQVLEKLFAGFGQRDASRGTVEQPNAELLFE